MKYATYIEAQPVMYAHNRHTIRHAGQERQRTRPQAVCMKWQRSRLQGGCCIAVSISVSGNISRASAMQQHNCP